MKLRNFAELITEDKNLCIIADWTFAGMYRCTANDIPWPLLDDEVVKLDSHEYLNELVITLKRELD